MSFDVFELNKKGVDAAMRGSMQKAEELFREATSLDNEFSEAAFNFIKLLHMQHRYHEAVLTFNHIIRTKSLSCLLYTSPSPRDKRQSRMPSSA